MRSVRAVLAAVALATALQAPGVRAKPSLIGHYRLAEGPDVAGQLVIAADGRFGYALAAGALDERAQGTWRPDGERVCLTTEPKPVPPAFRRLARAPGEESSPTILVSGPNGGGVAGIDFRIGFDVGDPLLGYTQEDGWTLPENEIRTPRWIELAEPIHGVASPRFELAPQDGGLLRAELVPNDLGVVDFAGACFEKAAKAFILHRREGDMRFVRARD